MPTPRDDRDTAFMETDDIRREIFTIWQQVVNDRSGAPEDSLNLFGRGGDSLMVFEFVARLSERFGVRIEAEAVFDHPTLGELTRHIELILLARRLTGGVAEAGAPISKPDPDVSGAPVRPSAKPWKARPSWPSWSV